MKTCAICGNAHSAGAWNAAKVIINGKQFAQTEYGKKKVCGLADLIDQQTAAPELLEACKAGLALPIPVGTIAAHAKDMEVREILRAALKKAGAQ